MTMTRQGAHCAWLAAFCMSSGTAAALEESSCRLESAGLPAVFAQCATLNVPARYSEPEGAQLELTLARVPAGSAAPQPDPLVLIAGGPGGSAIDFYLQTRAAFGPARRDRDVILLDQRGTGRSASTSGCALPEGLELETTGLEQLDRVVAECLADLDDDPRVLTTSAAVRDLERLRIELGIETWNVYGISYGTRVAQHYLRRFPAAVRTVILDGVVPAELALGPDVAPNAQTALTKIWGRCAATPACADAFGDLRPRFERLQAELAADRRTIAIADPFTGAPTEVAVGLDELRAVIRLMSYSAQTAAVLPLVVAEAERGNYAPLAGQARIVVRGLSEQLSFPMHNTVACTEDVPFYDAGADRANADTYLGHSVQHALETICAQWPRGPIDEDFKSPVVSEAPALLLSGEHDPITPPEYAEAVVAAGLPNAVHLVGRAQGHGMAGVGCVPRLMREFLNAPDRGTLDAACLADEPPMPFFVSFEGPSP